MKSEKQQLIHDLLDDAGRSGQALSAATHALRRRRQWRAVRHAVALITLAAMTAWLVLPGNQRPIAAHSSPVAAKLAAPQPAARSLTDAELLALFPNTPVALATLPNGKKLLIFPRPADQARFVNRL